ncbi:MAG: branched-chain amino acid ABC transporter permease [Actinomycetota bacterium]|nr:branched-chain amino acid ABC transporter permease [Acidimicrobiia bacterium]MDQ3294139.1 branched-chain amino acid ABC transporter permease [Actinomycetota bacterium]
MAAAFKPVRIQQGSPVHWALRAVGVAAMAYLLVLPIFQDLKPNQYGELADIAILALAALSLNLLIGFTGQISIGHSAFFGVGAYTTAALMDQRDWTAGWTFPVAAVLCFVVGVLVGIPALRLTGVYLTLVTLALAQIFPALVRKAEGITGGSFGITGLAYDPPSWTGLDASDRGDRTKWLYLLALGLLALGYVLVRNLVKSRVGRAMVSVRDNTTAAGVMGVNVAVTKTVVFGISAALAGVAGSVFALRQTQANPDTANFTILGAILFLVIMVIGGTASLLGPIVGAFVYYRVNQFTIDIPEKSWLPEWFRDFLVGRPNLATIVFAALLVVLMFVAPFGIVGLAKQTGRRFVHVVPKPPALAPAEQLAPAVDADIDDADSDPVVNPFAT